MARTKYYNPATGRWEYADKAFTTGVGGGAAFDPAVYGLPVLYLTGDTSGMSKENAVSLDYVYGERSGTASVKWQGSSSLSYPKKNYTIEFDSAFEAADGWGEQKKYCLKANYIDFSHARNVVSAKLWGEIVKSRQDEGGITSLITQGGHDVSHLLSIANGEVTVHGTMYNEGHQFFGGSTYPAGEHTVSFEVFNPNTAENDGDYAVLSFGIPGTAGEQFSSVNVNTVDAFSTWLSRSYTVTFPVDDSMIGFAIANPEAAEKGYIFRNIKIDGQTYPIEAMPNPMKYLINGGAVDGFPCVIMLNGAFHGLYTFNIPKDGWMFGMSDSTLQQAIVCADTQNDACGFKALATLTDDFDLEYVSDEDNADWVLTSLNRLIDAVMNSDGTDLDTTVAKYLDWQSAVDYLIFTSLLCGTDMVRKNYLLATFDGVKWYFSAYDMDSTYGLQWHGKGFDSASGYPLINEYNHRVMELIYTYKKDALLDGYEAIRSGILSENHVCQSFSNFAAGIPLPVLLEDAKRWPTIPSTLASNTAQILNWYRMRAEFVDKRAEEM